MQKIILQPKFKFSETREDMIEIHCPVCGFDCVHHESKTIVKNSNDNYEADKFVRGDVIEIPMWCEQSHAFTLKIGFHKGTSFLWAIHDGEKIHGVSK